MDSKVLVGAVTSDRHEQFLEKWLGMVEAFDHPHDLFLVDTTLGTDKYYKKLKKKGVNVARYEWDPEDKQCYEMLADARNMVREHFLADGYTHTLCLDSDEFLPPDGITRLLSHEKDIVGYPSPIWRYTPGVFKTGGYVRRDEGGFALAAYTWDELLERIMEEKSTLLKVHSVSVGACMFKKNVFEKVEWRVPKVPPIAEDTIFFTDLERAGFESYVDMGVIPLHFSVGWKDVPTFVDKVAAMNDRRMVIAHGLVTDDEPGTREIKYYGREPDNGKGDA